MTQLRHYIKSPGRVSILFSLILVCLLQCVSPLEIDQERPEDILIVEGFIDDDFGPHEIEVSLLALFAGVTEGGERRRVDANVRIVDDLGNTTQLAREDFIREELQSAPGPGCGPFINMQPATTNYMTPPDFRGVAGRSYSLEVELRDGTLYKSRFQELLHSPTIDSVFVAFNSRPGDEQGEPRTGLDVFLTWQDNPSEDNFHFWELGGVYRIQTPAIAGLCCIFDPRDGLADDCWVVEQNINESRELFEDRLTNGQAVVQNVGFIEDDGRRFATKELPAERQYYVEVTQYTMTEPAFRFFQNVETLAEINGEIFDPPPVGAQGNMINFDDPNELVVGFFGVFGKTKAGAFVNRNQIQDIKQHRVCGDCRAFAGGQLEIPEPYR